MNPDHFPLGAFEVDCDGSACGSPRAVGLYVHPPQYGYPAAGRVKVRDNKRVGYSRAEGITRLVTGGQR